MKVYSRQEEGATVVAPEKVVETGAVLGSIFVATVTVAAAKDLYSLTRKGLVKTYNFTLGRWLPTIDESKL
ncbi:MAG: hypothetical protein J6Y02_04680 [Pseudobutyrivibrio sp.]|nr:hypothetical protein [Pseudobutyrivibrio sp.]